MLICSSIAILPTQQNILKKKEGKEKHQYFMLLLKTPQQSLQIAFASLYDDTIITVATLCHPICTFFVVAHAQYLLCYSCISSLSSLQC